MEENMKLRITTFGMCITVACIVNILLGLPFWAWCITGFIAGIVSFLWYKKLLQDWR